MEVEAQAAQVGIEILVIVLLSVVAFMGQVGVKLLHQLHCFYCLSFLWLVNHFMQHLCPFRSVQLHQADLRHFS